MKNKKSQLKTQEMAFMLLAVVILFILAGLFFVTIRYRGLYQEAGELKKQDTIAMISKLAETAEFNCGEPFCIDTDKLMAMKNQKNYRGFWPVEKLEVRKIGENATRECSIENYPDCNLFKIYDAKSPNIETYSSYVSLCRREQENDYWYKKCEIGKIIAGIEPLQPEK